MRGRGRGGGDKAIKVTTEIMTEVTEVQREPRNEVVR